MVEIPDIGKKRHLKVYVSAFFQLMKLHRFDICDRLISRNLINPYSALKVSFSLDETPDDEWFSPMPEYADHFSEISPELQFLILLWNDSKCVEYLIQNLNYMWHF